MPALALVIGALTGITMASEGDGPQLGVAEHEEFGSYVVDAESNAVYLFLNDDFDSATSNCYDQCAENWPPLKGADASPGEGLDAGLIGATERDDNTSQVTYGGWPLYSFVQDEAPGDVTGQGVGDVWYLVAPDGTPIGRDDGSEEGDASGDEATDAAGAELPGSVLEGVYTTEQAAQGQEVYAEHCVSCHGPSLGGSPGGPGLKGPRMQVLWDGEPLGALFEYMRSEMPLASPGSLQAHQYADVMARILEANEYPAGEVELVPDTELLNDITFERP